MSYALRYAERQNALNDERRAEAGAYCSACGTPYRLEDLVEGRSGRMVCRWHYDHGIR